MNLEHFLLEARVSNYMHVQMSMHMRFRSMQNFKECIHWPNKCKNMNQKEVPESTNTRCIHHYSPSEWMHFPIKRRPALFRKDEVGTWPINLLGWAELHPVVRREQFGARGSHSPKMSQEKMGRPAEPTTWEWECDRKWEWNLMNGFFHGCWYAKAIKSTLEFQAADIRHSLSRGHDTTGWLVAGWRMIWGQLFSVSAWPFFYVQPSSVSTCINNFSAFRRTFLGFA